MEQPEQNSKKYKEMENACMAFKLRDGNIVLISRADVNELAAKIMVEHVIDNRITIQVEKCGPIERANYLLSILEKQKDMKPEMRDLYHREILKLMMDKTKSKEEPAFDLSGNASDLANRVDPKTLTP